MQQWLEGDVSGPTTKEVWGVADDGLSLKLKDLETWIRNGGILIPQSSNLKGKAKASSSSPTKPEDGRGSDVAKKSKKKKKLDSVAR